MPTTSDGGAAAPDATSSSGGAGSQTRNQDRQDRQSRRQRRGGRGNRNQNRSNRSRAPDTAEESLGRNYFDMPGTDWTLPNFQECVKRVLNYFVSTRQSASDYMIVAESGIFVLPPVTEPPRPGAGATDDERFIWKEEYKEYKRDKKVREDNEGALFGLLTRQSTDQFMQCVCEHQEWETIRDTYDTMRLLTIFEHISATGGTVNVDPYQLLVQAQERYYSFYQSKDMTNAEYHSRFMHLANVAIFCNAALGASIPNLRQLCIDDGNNVPSLFEVENKVDAAREREMAMLFLLHSDKVRYGSIVAQCINNRLISNGTQTFPTTMAGALELLNSSRPLTAPHRTNRDQNSNSNAEIGTSFATDARAGDGNRDNERSGRGGRGGGRGGDRSGRGGGRGNWRNERGERNGANRDDQVNVADADHDDQNSENQNDNNSNGVGFYSASSRSTAISAVAEQLACVDEDIASIEFNFMLSNGQVATIKARRIKHPKTGLPITWIIIDTGSTANIFCNRELLHDIHKVGRKLKVRCNAGVVELDEMGYFGDYPEPVWFNPNGIANILSHHNVNKHYYVEYLSGEEDRFIVQMGEQKVEFLPTEKGLYFVDWNVVKQNGWVTMIQTVKGQKPNILKPR